MPSSLIENTVQAHVERDGAAATYIKVRAQVLLLATEMAEESRNGKVSEQSLNKLKLLSVELPRATAIYRAHLARVSLLIQASGESNPDYLGQVQRKASALAEDASAMKARAVRLEQVCGPCKREISEVVAAADLVESGRGDTPDFYDLSIIELDIVSNVKKSAPRHLPPSAQNSLSQILEDKELFSEPLFVKSLGKSQFTPHRGNAILANRPIDELELIKASTFRSIAKISAETVRVANEYSRNASKIDAMQAALTSHGQAGMEAMNDVDMVNA